MPAGMAPAADHGVLEGLAGEAGRGRPEAQGLVEDLPHVGQAVDLLEGRLSGGTQDGVDLLAGAASTSGFFIRK